MLNNNFIILKRIRVLKGSKLQSKKTVWPDKRHTQTAWDYIQNQIFKSEYI